MDNPLTALEDAIRAAGHEVILRPEAGVWLAFVDGERVASDPSPRRVEAELRAWWEDSGNVS